MDYKPKYKIEVKDEKTQDILKTYLAMKREGPVDRDDLFFQLQNAGNSINDLEYLLAVIEYMECIHVWDIDQYEYFIEVLPQSAYEWNRQSISPKEFQYLFCKLSNVVIYFARKDIVPEISNSYILAWRFQYESFTGFKLNKDKIGYIIKVLNQAGLMDIRKNKQQKDGRWSILHTVLLGKNHPSFHSPMLSHEQRVEIQQRVQRGLITDFERNKRTYYRYYSYWIKQKMLWM